MIFLMFWGTPSQPGSLCNVRDYISRKEVVKEASPMTQHIIFIGHFCILHFISIRWTGLTSLGIGNYGFHIFWELGEKTFL